jgi:hypothetical protein
MSKMTCTVKKRVPKRSMTVQNRTLSFLNDLLIFSRFFFALIITISTPFQTVRTLKNACHRGQPRGAEIIILNIDP